jgi:hypothetical protein
MAPVNIVFVYTMYFHPNLVVISENRQPSVLTYFSSLFWRPTQKGTLITRKLTNLGKDDIHSDVAM